MSVQTASGKALIEWIGRLTPAYWTGPNAPAEQIAAIEQEAAALALDRVEAAVRALPFAFDSGRRRAVLAAIAAARGDPEAE